MSHFANTTFSNINGNLVAVKSVFHIFMFVSHLIVSPTDCIFFRNVSFNLEWNLNRISVFVCVYAVVDSKVLF